MLQKGDPGRSLFFYTTIPLLISFTRNDAVALSNLHFARTLPDRPTPAKAQIVSEISEIDWHAGMPVPVYTGIPEHTPATTRPPRTPPRKLPSGRPVCRYIGSASASACDTNFENTWPIGQLATCAGLPVLRHTGTPVYRHTG